MKKTFQEENKLEWQTVASGVQRKIMNYNTDIMMVKVLFEKGAVGALHQHPHIQSSYVAEGCFDVTINGQTQTLNKGDSFFVASNLTHGVVCKEAGILIDVFSPYREDFLKDI